MTSVQAIDVSTASIGNLKIIASQPANSTKQFQQLLNGKSNENNLSKLQKKDVSAKKTSMDKTESFDSSYSEMRSDNSKNVVNTTQDKENVITEKTLQDVQQDMKDIVQDVTGMDDDTLQSLLDMMGITLTDLLNPVTLQQFVLQANGASEDMELLTNEALMNCYTELLQSLTDYMSENQEQILAALEQLAEPASLDEFGITEEDLQTVQSEVVDSDVATENADTVVRDMQQEGIVTNGMQDTDKASKNMDAENKLNDADMADSKTDTAVVTKSLSQEENASDSANEQEGKSQEDIQKLFATDTQEVSSKGEQNEQPLFSQQLNVVQGNVSQVYDAASVSSQRMQQMVNIVHQVSEQMQQSVTPDTTSLEMQLNPESLGKVLLTLVSREGIMTATFHVQSEEARQALESQMFTLRENLEAKEIKVESVEVYVSDFSFEQSTEAEAQRQSDMNKNNKRKFRYDDAEDEEEVAEEESVDELRREVMRNNGSSIDFTA